VDPAGISQRRSGGSIHPILSLLRVDILKHSALIVQVSISTTEMT